MPMDEAGPATSTLAIRLIFEYEGDQVRLISQQPVDVAITGFDISLHCRRSGSGRLRPSGCCAGHGSQARCAITRSARNQPRRGKLRGERVGEFSAADQPIGRGLTMSTADGAVIGSTQIFGSAPRNRAFNIVLLAEGFTIAQQAGFDNACTQFLNAIRSTPPFDELSPAINVFRVNVSSTDSGADDPVAAGGTGATVRTYFDATFGGNRTRPAIHLAAIRIAHRRDGGRRCNRPPPLQRVAIGIRRDIGFRRLAGRVVIMARLIAASIVRVFVR